MRNRKLIICVTAKEHESQCLLYKSIEKCKAKYSNWDNIDVCWVTNNKQGLNKVYNDVLITEQYYGIEHIDNYSHAFLIHDDVELRGNINDIDFGEFTIIGLAGANNVTIKSPFLWHLTSPREDQLGAVAHTTPDGGYMITSFGPFNKRAVLIDGVFLGLKLDKNYPLFDENIPTGFHFYDLCFSLDCNLKGVKVGVVDFPITHCSPGLSKGFEEWKKGEEYVLNKYSKYLNKTLKA